jgi:hypothetical protein
MYRIVGSARLAAFFSLAAFFNLVAAAGAQTPAPSIAGAAFDGTYALVSAAKVNQSYTTRGGQMGQCPDRTAGTLIIRRGRARYTSATGNRLTGTVGPQGELALRSVAPPNSGGSYRPVEINVNGSVDGSGTARARQMGNSCSYDFVWRKQSR